MLWRNVSFTVAAALAWATAAAAQDVLMVPDSTSDRVFLFSAVDGSLVDDNFIDGSGILNTPINAVSVGDEVWISDQLGDSVFKFDADGNFLGKLVETGLDNIRGIELRADLLYVSNSGTANGAPDDAIVVYDLAGNQQDIWTGLGDPFDILLRDADFLVNDIGADDKISRVDFDGNLLGLFGALDVFDFPEQMTQRANGNILLATFSSPAGVYEFDADGNQLNYWAVGTGLRGVHELTNGNILWTNGTGTWVLDPNTGQSTQVASGSMRFIEPLGGGPDCDAVSKLKAKCKNGKLKVSVKSSLEEGTVLNIDTDCAGSKQVIINARGAAKAKFTGLEPGAECNVTIRECPDFTRNTTCR